MIGTALIATMLAGAAAPDARAAIVAAPLAVQEVASARPEAPRALRPAIDPGTDPDHPAPAWLARMVRPCVRNGSRAVC